MSEIYRLKTIPNSDAYVFAFSQPFVQPHHRRMLLAHRLAAGSIIGVEEMAAQLGVFGHGYVNLHYGSLAHKIADLLDLDVARYSSNSPRPLWTTAIAQGLPQGPAGKWYWLMYSEVIDAVDRLQWARQT